MIISETMVNFCKSLFYQFFFDIFVSGKILYFHSSILNFRRRFRTLKNHIIFNFCKTFGTPSGNVAKSDRKGEFFHVLLYFFRDTFYLYKFS